MDVMPTTIYTRRIALAAEYGIDASDIPEDGFTNEYVEIIGMADETLFPNSPRVDHLFESNSIPRTRVYWAREDRAPAEAAIMGDYHETIGEESFQQVQALKANLRAD